MRRKTEAILRKIRLRLHIKKIMRDNKDILDKIGSDYDEHGKPYWYYHEVNCACTKCMP
jgi:hypothetical protein